MVFPLFSQHNCPHASPFDSTVHHRENRLLEAAFTHTHTATHLHRETRGGKIFRTHFWRTNFLCARSGPPIVQRFDVSVGTHTHTHTRETLWCVRNLGALSYQSLVTGGGGRFVGGGLVGNLRIFLFVGGEISIILVLFYAHTHTHTRFSRWLLGTVLRNRMVSILGKNYKLRDWFPIYYHIFELEHYQDPARRTHANTHTPTRRTHKRTHTHTHAPCVGVCMLLGGEWELLQLFGKFGRPRTHTFQ